MSDRFEVMGSRVLLDIASAFSSGALEVRHARALKFIVEALLEAHKRGVEEGKEWQQQPRSANIRFVAMANEVVLAVLGRPGAITPQYIDNALQRAYRLGVEAGKLQAKESEHG